MYTIILSDGTRLENLVLNGNNYIAEGIIEDSVFEDNLSSVTITDGQTQQTYEDMLLIANRPYDGVSWFILGEKSESQKREEALMNRISLLTDQNSMLTECILEMSEIVYA